MNNECRAVIKQDGDWWMGWIEEIPGVNCQEASHDELIESLKVTLEEALAFNREESSSHKNLERSGYKTH
jgi:predicted RNase H-like HicB family nuclease